MAGPLVDAKRRSHLVGHDVGERGLAETRRPVEEQVVEGFAALAGRADEDREVLAQAVLARPSRRGCGAGEPPRNAARRAAPTRRVRHGIRGISFIAASLFREARTRTSSVASEPASSAASASTRSACRSGVAEIEQRRQRLLARRSSGLDSDRRSARRPVATASSSTRSRSSTRIRSAILVPTPGTARSAPTSLAADRREQLRRRDPREDRLREPRPDAVGPQQQLEGHPLARVERSRRAGSRPRGRGCRSAARRSLPGRAAR